MMGKGSEENCVNPNYIFTPTDLVCIEEILIYQDSKRGIRAPDCVMISSGRYGELVKSLGSTIRKSDKGNIFISGFFRGFEVCLDENLLDNEIKWEFL